MNYGLEKYQHLLDNCRHLVYQNPRKAIELAKAAEKLALQQGNGYSAEKARHLMLTGLIQSGQFLPALEQAYLLLNQIKDDHNHSWISQLHLAISQCLQHAGQYGEAVNSLYRAREMAKTQALPNLVGRCYLQLASLMLESQQFESALNVMRQLKHEVNLEDLEPELVAELTYFHGLCWLGCGRLEQAQHNFESAQQQAETHKMAAGLLKNELKLAHLLGLKQSWDQALGVVSHAVKRALELGNVPLLVECFVQRADIQERVGLPDDAIHSLKKALFFMKGRQTRQTERVHESLSILFKQCKNLFQANEHLEMALKLTRSLSVKENSISLEAMQMKLDYDRRQQETEAEQQRAEHLLQQNQQLSLINALGTQVSSSLDAEKVVELMYRELSNYMGCDQCAVALLAEDEQGKKVLDYRYLVTLGQWDKPFRQPLNLKNRLDLECMTSGECIWENQTEGDYRSVVMIPLMDAGKAFGLFRVQAKESEQFNQSQINFIQAMPAFLSIAIKNCLIHEQHQNFTRGVIAEKEAMAFLAQHDSLTNLLNRMGLEKRFDEWTTHSNPRFALMYVDLDNFKRINDCYGHMVGDQVLKILATRMKNSVRETDLVARIGGDEFVILLNDISSPKDAHKVVAAIREKIKAGISLTNLSLNTSASIGVARFPLHGTSIEQLLVAADQAMYSIKHDHKDGVVYL